MDALTRITNSWAVDDCVRHTVSRGIRLVQTSIQDDCGISPILLDHRFSIRSILVELPIGHSHRFLLHPLLKFRNKRGCG